MAAKVVTIVGDVTGPQQRHTHKIYLHLVNKIKGVSKYCNKSKTLRGGRFINPLVPGCWYEFACASEG